MSAATHATDAGAAPGAREGDQGDLTPAGARSARVSEHAAPVVKWVGGKTKLLPELIARMPKRYGTYYEPFVGGGALFFAVGRSAGAGRAVLGDANTGLVNLYTTLAAAAEPVIAALAALRSAHGEAHYYAQRARWNAGDLPAVEAAALFVYLNKTCFNGLWRVNRAGEHNVPMGRYADPLVGVADRLRAAAPVLARATLRCGDYRDTVAAAQRGDFVYFDPPYDSLTSSTDNATAYNAAPFGSAQQHELAALARTLVARGVRVMLSNHDTPLVRSLYRGFRIDSVTCARAINSRGDRRGAVAEVIVTGGYRLAAALDGPDAQLPLAGGAP